MYVNAKYFTLFNDLYGTAGVTFIAQLKCVCQLIFINEGVSNKGK